MCIRRNAVMVSIRNLRNTEKNMSKGGLLDLFRVVGAKPRYSGSRPTVVLKSHRRHHQHKPAKRKCMWAYNTWFTVLVWPKT
jgi:hypothetical protein